MSIRVSDIRRLPRPPVTERKLEEGLEKRLQRGKGLTSLNIQAGEGIFVSGDPETEEGRGGSKDGQLLRGHGCVLWGGMETWGREVDFLNSLSQQPHLRPLWPSVFQTEAARFDLERLQPWETGPMGGATGTI